MSTGTRVSLTEAWRAADGLLSVLALGAERAMIAGSIRRCQPDVGDIEIVAVPRMQTVPEGMFETREVNELDVVVDSLILEGTLALHPTDPKRGPRYSKLLHRPSGLQLDLFSASARTFGLILLIRTGPSWFSQHVVTEARRRGFHVAEGELHRGAGECNHRRACEVVETPEEADVAEALGLFLPVPEQRS